MFGHVLVWVMFRYKSMADCEVKAAKMARILAILHIIFGFLLICFGIADLVVAPLYFWTGVVCFGIWSGGLVSGRSTKYLLFATVSRKCADDRFSTLTFVVLNLIEPP